MAVEIRGLVAALLTPRRADGTVDIEGVERNADFVLSNGATGVAPCGGTGEYFDIPIPDRERMLEALVPIVRGRGQLVAGVGAARLDDSARLAHHALSAGADAVLLPPPHFFHYGQPELSQFFRAAAAAIGGPTLIYNLAGFLSPISPSTVAGLLRDEPQIVGVKDSKGTLEMLGHITARKIPGSRLQGHDTQLASSLRAGLADGAISGPAGVVPDVMAPLFDHDGDSPEFSAAEGHIDEFLQRLQALPYPWVLKWAAGCRGLGRARLPFPPGRDHREARKQFEAWFEAWLARATSGE